MSENKLQHKRKAPLISMRNLTCVFLAVTIFLAIDPFFVWKTFAGEMGPSVYKLMQTVTMVLLAVMLPWANMPIKRMLAAISMMGIFLFYCFFTGRVTGTTHPFVIGNILVYLFYALTAVTDRDILVRSFGILRTIFAVLLGYTLIIYALLLLGIRVPYKAMLSAESGRVAMGFQYYQNHLGCLLINENGKTLYRFAGVFTEPGVVGTFCAFFLAADGFKIKGNKQNLIFLISGILSLSVAFYVLAAMVYVIHALRTKGYKKMLILATLLIAYFVFINIDFSNAEITKLQERFIITETGLAGDNRITELAQRQYEALWKGDIRTLLLGHGYPREDVATMIAWQMTTSYKESIYCVGLLGYGLMIAWFILTPLCCYKSPDRSKNASMYVYILIFLASQYQRPYMKALFLTYILLAGCLWAQEYTQKQQQV